MRRLPSARRRRAAQPGKGGGERADRPSIPGLSEGLMFADKDGVDCALAAPNRLLTARRTIVWRSEAALSLSFFSLSLCIARCIRECRRAPPDSDLCTWGLLHQSSCCERPGS
eukprot:254727-Chlamydomonas_euryale.AAC.16